jgi:hypothetical protein
MGCLNVKMRSVVIVRLYENIHRLPFLRSKNSGGNGMKIILETDYYNLYENEEGQKIIIKKGD